MLSRSLSVSSKEATEEWCPAAVEEEGRFGSMDLRRELLCGVVWRMSPGRIGLSGGGGEEMEEIAGGGGGGIIC